MVEGGYPGLVVHNAVEQRTELRLEHRCLQSDHGAAPHFRPEGDLVHRLHHSDRIERIGADDEEIGICRLHRAHDGREVGRIRRIVLVVEDFQAGSLGVFTRALAGVAPELGIGRRQRNALRLGILRERNLEKSIGESGL